MTDFAKELFSSNVQPQPEQTDFASELFGTKAISGRQVGSGQFAPIEPEPKAISEPSRGASALTAFMGGIPTDKQAAVNYFASQRGISPSRYRIIDGDIAYQADDGKFYKEVSGLGATAAYYAPDVMEMVPDVGAGIALAPLAITSPVGTATAAGGVGAVAAGTNYLRQKIAGKIAGQELDPFQVGLSGLLSGTAELAPAVRKGFQERRLARDIAQVDPKLVASLRAKVNMASH